MCGGLPRRQLVVLWGATPNLFTPHEASRALRGDLLAEASAQAGQTPLRPSEALAKEGSSYFKNTPPTTICYRHDPSV